VSGAEVETGIETERGVAVVVADESLGGNECGPMDVYDYHDTFGLHADDGLGFRQ